MLELSRSPSYHLREPCSFSGNDRERHEIPIMFEIILSLYQAIPHSSGTMRVLLTCSA